MGGGGNTSASGNVLDESGWSTPNSDLQASIPIAGSASSGTIPDIVKAQKRTSSRSESKKKKHHSHHGHHSRRGGEKGSEKKGDEKKALVAKITEVLGGR